MKIRIFILSALLAASATTHAATIATNTTVDIPFSPLMFKNVNPTIRGLQADVKWDTDLNAPQNASLQIFSASNLTKPILDCAISKNGGCGLGGSLLNDLAGLIRVQNQGAEFNLNSLSLSIQNSSGSYIFYATGQPVPEPSTWQLMLLGILSIGGAFFSNKATKKRRAGRAGLCA